MRCVGIMTKIFPILMTDTISETHEAQKISTHLGIPACSNYWKQNYKGGQTEKKRHITHRETNISITADFSTETKRPEATG